MLQQAKQEPEKTSLSGDDPLLYAFLHSRDVLVEEWDVLSCDGNVKMQTAYWFPEEEEV